MSRQQTLAIDIPPQRDYGVWVRHRGVEEACNRMALWLVRGGRLHLDSAAPAGKSHLLRALAEEHPGRLGVVEAVGGGGAHRLVEQWHERLARHPFWAVDLPAGAAPPAVALALFHLLERARDERRPIVVAWRAPDDGLPPELSSRLRAMASVRMQPPAEDADWRAVLLSMARAMQWHVPAHALDPLFEQLPRDLGAMDEALARLERAALAERKRISRAWVARQVALLRGG
ncbi:MAG: hypothetical protein R8K47_04690 [Mariprofundaceae bacterium]